MRLVLRRSPRSDFGSRLSDGRSRRLLCLRDSAARMQCVDFAPAEPELLEDLFIVFSQRRGSPRRHLGDAMHLNGTADRGAELATGAVEWNYHLIQPQLRILDDFP